MANLALCVMSVMCLGFLALGGNLLYYGVINYSDTNANPGIWVGIILVAVFGSSLGAACKDAFNDKNKT